MRASCAFLAAVGALLVGALPTFMLQRASGRWPLNYVGQGRTFDYYGHTDDNRACVDVRRSEGVFVSHTNTHEMAGENGRSQCCNRGTATRGTRRSLLAHRG